MSELTGRILTKAGRAGLRRVKPIIPSRTLRRACKYVPVAETLLTSKGALRIPHYWARMVHDGHPTSKPKQARVLLWYKNPIHDPRISRGRTPERFAQRSQLTRGQIKKDIKAGKLIAARISPKSDTGFAKKPFFGNAPGEGMSGFVQEVHEIARKEISREVREFTKKPGALEKRLSVASVSL